MDAPRHLGSAAVTGPDAPSYEQARDELAEVVRRLEAGGVTLEESLALWERGEQLAAICQTWLDGARARLAAAAPADASDSTSAE
jgi:exodeoxyribonuclease VII small subunit